MQNKSLRIWLRILSSLLALLLLVSGHFVYRIQRKNQRLTELTAALFAAQESCAALEAEIVRLNEIFNDETLASNEYQRRLLAQIEELEAEIVTLKTEISGHTSNIVVLNELLANYESYTAANFGFPASFVSDLWLDVLEANRPTRTVVVETVDEKTGEIISTEEKIVPANVAFYYKDLTTGYTLSYNSDEVLYIASMVKVPYVYALLKTVADFEYRKRNFDAAGNPLYDANGKPLFQGQHPNLDADGNILYLEGEEKYNLNRVWTFNKAWMMNSGSGYIKDMEDGVQFTYLELVEYAIRYSDNIAFTQLGAMFGYVEYFQMAQSLGVKGYSNGFMNMSATECGKFLEAVYRFTEEDQKYGSLLKEYMIRSNYPMIIPQGVSPTPVAHKYGWDFNAYHDMGIVYNEHPYVLVVMSDLDNGGSDECLYVRGIVRAIHAIHKNYHSNK